MIDVIAVRGATSVPAGEDEGPAMVAAVGELVAALTRENGFTSTDVISVQFTQTADLRRKNAATALREALPEYGDVPLFCSLEPDVEGSLPGMVRVLIMWRGTGPVRPVYHGAAVRLRPDLN